MLRFHIYLLWFALFVIFEARVCFEALNYQDRSFLPSPHPSKDGMLVSYQLQGYPQGSELFYPHEWKKVLELSEVSYLRARLIVVESTVLSTKTLRHFASHENKLERNFVFLFAFRFERIPFKFHGNDIFVS